MAGPLVVVGEPRGRYVGAGSVGAGCVGAGCIAARGIGRADLRDPLDDGEPFRLPRRRGGRVGGPVDVHGIGRVVGEEVLDVHEQQFLVLLLVMTAQLEQLEAALVDVVRLEGRDHGLVDPRPEVGDLGDRWPRDEPALGARLPGPDRLVIRVEQEAEHRLRRHVPGHPAQDELLEEPRGVRAVPRRGAGGGHGLGDLILGTEPGREQVREPAHPKKSLDDAPRARSGADGADCHGIPRGSWSTAGGLGRGPVGPPAFPPP